MQEYRRGSTVFIIQKSTGGGRSTGIGNSSAGVEEEEAVKLEAGYRVTQHQLLATTASSACALLSLSLN